MSLHDKIITVFKNIEKNILDVQKEIPKSVSDLTNDKNYLTNVEAEQSYVAKEESKALSERVDEAYPEYDFDETYVITEEEATATSWVKDIDSEGNPIRLSEMQVDFTIPAGENTGVQYLYFQYENTEKPASPHSMRVTEFAYQNTSKERYIRAICYKERDSFYSVKGYAWNDNDNYTSLQSTMGVRMGVGTFIKNPTPLRGVWFNVANGTPVAGTTVRIRGKRRDEN